MLQLYTHTLIVIYYVTKIKHTSLVQHKANPSEHVCIKQNK